MLESTSKNSDASRPNVLSTAQRKPCHFADNAQLATDDTLQLRMKVPQEQKAQNALPPAGTRFMWAHQIVQKIEPMQN